MGATVSFRRNPKFIHSKYMTTEVPVNIFFKDETQIYKGWKVIKRPQAEKNSFYALSWWVHGALIVLHVGHK